MGSNIRVWKSLLTGLSQKSHKKQETTVSRLDISPQGFANSPNMSVKQLTRQSFSIFVSDTVDVAPVLASLSLFSCVQRIVYIGM